MSSAGHVMAMITSLKNNARSKRKVFKDLYNRYHEYRDAEHRTLKERDLSNQQLERINAKIRQKIKRDYRKKVRNTIMVFSVVLLLLFLLLRGLSQWTAHKITAHQQEKNQEELTKSEQVNNLLYLGNRELAKGNYGGAKNIFKKAVALDGKHFQANTRLVDCYVTDCVLNGRECEAAQFYLQKFKYKFGEGYHTDKWEKVLKSKL